VIDRETEAALAVIGCSPLLDPKGRGAILFDIGGGSTELVRIERDPDEPDALPRIKAWMSIPLGVVTLAEHFGGKEVTGQSYARMVEEVAQHVTPFAAEHGADLTDMHLLGTSGTVTTLAGVHLNLVRYDRRRIDGVWLSDADITEVIARPARHELPGARRQQLHQHRARPTWCWRAAPSSMPSATPFRCLGCVSPTAACARACWWR